MDKIDFAKELDLTGSTDELLAQLVEKSHTDSFDMKYKWLHEMAIFWGIEIQNSLLFTKEEIRRILPLWLAYFQDLLSITDFEKWKDFMKFAECDFIQKDKIYQSSYDWETLMMQRMKSVNVNEALFADAEPPTPTESEDGDSNMPDVSSENESDGDNSSESDIEVLSHSTNQSRQSPFTKKLNFLLDLFLPNNFQYTLFKHIFTPEKLDHKPQKIKTIVLPHVLEFFALPYFDDYKLKKSKKPSREDGSKVQFLPLKKALEINKEFFDTLGDKELAKLVSAVDSLKIPDEKE